MCEEGDTVDTQGGGCYLRKAEDWSTETEEWRKIKHTGEAVEGRRNHIAVIVGRYMIIHGGMNTEGEYLNDIKILNMTTMKWSSCHADGENEFGVAQHTAVAIYHPDRRRKSLNKLGDLTQPPKLPHSSKEGISITVVNRRNNYNFDY